MMASKRLLDGIKVSGTMLLAGILASGLFIPALTAQSAAPATKPAGISTRYQPDKFAGRAGRYYLLIWGIDSLSVKVAESGELIRFSYRVLDTDKANALHYNKIDPMLILPDGNIKLVIPSLEKVGQLRQSGTPEAGRSYWMAFSNPRKTVKRGDLVNVVIGQFHADGLVVE
jgi:hypothetical protein